MAMLQSKSQSAGTASPPYGESYTPAKSYVQGAHTRPSPRRSRVANGCAESRVASLANTFQDPVRDMHHASRADALQAPHGVGYTPNTTLGYGPEAYTFTLVRWGWAIPCIPCTMVFWGLAKLYLGRYWLSYTLTLGSSSRVHTSKYHIPHVPHTTSIP